MNLSFDFEKALKGEYTGGEYAVAYFGGVVVQSLYPSGVRMLRKAGYRVRLVKR